MGNINGFESALEALRYMDGPTQKRILADIQKQDPKMAARLKSHLVRFEDILKINPQGFLRLFQEVKEYKWVLALRGQQESFVEAVLKPLALRKADLLRAALAQLGPQSVSKIEGAQREILETALKLESEGLLLFSHEDDPLV